MGGWDGLISGIEKCFKIIHSSVTGGGEGWVKFFGAGIFFEVILICRNFFFAFARIFLRHNRLQEFFF